MGGVLGIPRGPESARGLGGLGGLRALVILGPMGALAALGAGEPWSWASWRPGGPGDSRGAEARGWGSREMHPQKMATTCILHQPPLKSATQCGQEVRGNMTPHPPETVNFAESIRHPHITAIPPCNLRFRVVKKYATGWRHTPRRRQFPRVQKIPRFYINRP